MTVGKQAGYLKGTSDFKLLQNYFKKSGAWEAARANAVQCGPLRYLRMKGALEERQKRRWIGPHVEVSPKSERRQAPTLASGPAQRIPESHGGVIVGEESAFWKKPVVKPMSRHASSGVLWTALNS